MPTSPPVAIIMGSQSDWPNLRHAAETLDALKIDYEARIISAHRTPDRMYEFARGAKAEGFRTIINNRPDGEEPGQPASCYLAAAAKVAGLDYYHIPILPGQYADDQIDAFREVMRGCGKPALAFCRSGMRATTLWALSQAGKLTPEEIVRQASACGFDLEPLVPAIATRAKP